MESRFNKSEEDNDLLEDYCPHCGAYTGGDSVCPACGETLYDDSGLSEVNEDEDDEPFPDDSNEE